jgi:hypothetical protein
LQKLHIFQRTITIHRPLPHMSVCPRSCHYCL